MHITAPDHVVVHISMKESRPFITSAMAEAMHILAASLAERSGGVKERPNTTKRRGICLTALPFGQLYGGRGERIRTSDLSVPNAAR